MLIMRLSDSLRNRFKIPLGILLVEDKAQKTEIQKHIPDGSYVITVGDRTTRKMMAFGLMPCLQIIDGREQREQDKDGPPPQMPPDSTELFVENPAAQITMESINSIRKALEASPPVRLHVRGEEDLLVVPACIYAPTNAIVMYGQPNEGLVIVKVTSEIRNKAQLLLDSME